MKIVFACLFSITVITTSAQSVDTSFKVSDISLAARYASLIDTADLRKHLYTIASAEMEGRETATEGQRKAAAYIEQHFQSTGLKTPSTGSYQQPFPVYRDSLVKAELSIGDVTLKNDTGFAVASDAGVDTSLDATEIVFAGYGLSDSLRDDYAGLNVKGKIVLVVPGSPTQKTNGKKKPGNIPPTYVLQEAAAKNGAAALLIADKRFPRKSKPALGSMYFKSKEQTILPATFFISPATARMIMGASYDSVKKMTSSLPGSKTFSGRYKLALQHHTQQLESTNVIGIIEGSEKPHEAIIITAHYDHIGKRDSIINYGADDDGSGTVTILELSEAFSAAVKEGSAPKRTVIFMTVSGEEKGLWGSEFYSDNPVFPLDSTSVNINIDMIGRVESEKRKDSLNYVYVVGDNRISSELRPLSETINKKTLDFTLDYRYNDVNDPQRIYYRSDHYNFAKYGVPAIFYFNGFHDDYHRPSDTPDKINYALLAKRAQLIFYTAWEIANRNEMLKRF